MPLMPGAQHRLLPENSTQALITPTQHILHSGVTGRGESDLYPYFSRPDVKLESHFFIQTDGDILQYMDTSRRADANGAANVRAISTETDDDGAPDTQPWTQAQLDSIVQLHRWLHETHGIPLTKIAKMTGPGIGWHSMWSFRDPINLSGGYLKSPWTSVRGKTCPGRIRIQQFVNHILPQLEGEHTMAGPYDAKIISIYEDERYGGRTPAEEEIAQWRPHFAASEAFASRDLKQDLTTERIKRLEAEIQALRFDLT